MRVVPGAGGSRWDADPAEHVYRGGEGLPRVPAVVESSRLRDLPPDSIHRVERGHRVLEDHRDLAAADLAHLVLADPGQVLALEHDLAADDPSRPLQPHDAHRGHRLAAAGLADDAERLAGVQLERDAVDRFDGALFGREHRVQVLDLEQGLGHGRVKTSVSGRRRHGRRCRTCSRRARSRRS